MSAQEPDIPEPSPETPPQPPQEEPDQRPPEQPPPTPPEAPEQEPPSQPPPPDEVPGCRSMRDPPTAGILFRSTPKPGLTVVGHIEPV